MQLQVQRSWLDILLNVLSPAGTLVLSVGVYVRSSSGVRYWAQRLD